ncbi:MAG: hypothetical protein E6R03_13655, partial [Hyphomicrobiaceae bacterium]
MTDYNYEQQQVLFKWVYRNFKKVKKEKTSWVNCACPQHEDKSPSFSINLATGGYFCHSQRCPNPRGHLSKLEMPEAYPIGSSEKTIDKTPPREDRYYIYRDERGRNLLRVTRTPDKKFFQARWVAGKWESGGTQATRRPLYRLPELLNSDEKTIYWVEGEKDCENLVALGVQATTTAGGADNLSKLCRRSARAALSNKVVIIIPDRDEAGNSYALQAESIALAYANEVNLLRIPTDAWDDPKKPNKDISDWIAFSKGGVMRTKEDLAALVDEYTEHFLDPYDRPMIISSDRDLRDVSQEMVGILRQSNNPEPWLFCKDGWITRIQQKTDGSPYFRELNATILVGLMAEFAAWKRRKGKQIVDCFPSEQVAKDILGRLSDQFPAVAEIAFTPVMSSTGRLLRNDGFYPEDLLYLKSIGLSKMAAVPKRPTEADVAEAKRFIFEEWLCNYPFDGQSSKCHALALMLTPFVRRMVKCVPMFLIDGNANGTGKTKLAKILAWPALGSDICTMGETNDE